MTFDIYALEKMEEYDEEDAIAYQEALHELFVASPEGQAYAAINPEMGFWSYQSIYYAHAYIGVTLTEMDRSDMEELLLELFPRKISFGDVEKLQDAIPEIIAFWQYLQRAYQLPRAAEVLDFLQHVEPKFIKAMQDPSKFGMAKSFFMQGQAAGLDMANEQQMNTLMHLHNLAVMQGKTAGLPLPPNLSEIMDAMRGEERSSVSFSPVKRNKARAAKNKKKKQRRR